MIIARRGVLKISNFIICLYRTVFEINSSFHAESVRKYLLKKLQPPPPPPPLEIKWCPPYHY